MQLEHVVTQWNAILFRLFCVFNFLQTSLLFLSIYKTFIEIIILSGVFQLGISIWAYMLGKAWHHSVASYDLYLFICVQRMQSHFCLFLKPSFCNSVHDLNWNVKQAWKNVCTNGILSNKDSWCLAPFSSNTSCHSPQSVSVLATVKAIVPYISSFVFQQGTQQENSATKHAFTIRFCDCNSWQSEWGFGASNVYLLLCTA